MEEQKELNNEKKGNKIILGLIFIIILVLCYFGGFYLGKQFANIEDKSNSNEKQGSNQEEIVDKTEEPIQEEEEFILTDKNGGGYGTAIVTGYVTKEVIKAAEGDAIPMPDQTIVYFNITDTKNTNFLSYLNQSPGNFYISDMEFSMGCYDDNKIVYMNDSDSKGMSRYELTEEDSSVIMNSTVENPVKLKVEVYEFTGGSGAPECYSFISQVKVIK